MRATCPFNSRPRRLLCSVSSNLRRTGRVCQRQKLIRYTAVCAGKFFLGIFFGYAAYYLVRKNFALAMPYLVEQGFSRGDLGFALSGISIAYGFSKFIMGSVSDRSNPRVFLPAGLILAAAVMLFMGFVPWATSSIAFSSCCCSSAAGSRGWGGRRADVPWCTGGRRRNAAVSCRCGTARITSVAVFRRCCSCWGWPGSKIGRAHV